MRTTPCSRPDRGAGHPAGPGAQLVDRQPRRDRGQPGLGESPPHPHPVAGAVQEGFLHDGFGLAHAAHDPVGDGQQQRPEVLVPLCPWRSGSILTCIFSHPDTAAFPSVTPIGDPSTLPLGGAPPASSLLHLLAQPVSGAPADPRSHCGHAIAHETNILPAQLPTVVGCLGCTRQWASGSRIAAGRLYAVTAAVVRVWQNPAVPPPEGDPVGAENGVCRVDLRLGNGAGGHRRSPSWR
jgi:hypothetical protein